MPFGGRRIRDYPVNPLLRHFDERLVLVDRVFLPVITHAPRRSDSRIVAFDFQDLPLVGLHRTVAKSPQRSGLSEVGVIALRTLRRKGDRERRQSCSLTSGKIVDINDAYTFLLGHAAIIEVRVFRLPAAD